MPITKTWKATERMIAKRLNGERLGFTGRANEDVRTDWLCVECKHRKSLPSWLKAAMRQAVAACRDGRLPIVVLHELGKRHDNDLVCMRLKDFEEWWGDVEMEKEVSE